MDVIEYSPTLNLGNPEMDDTHREFAALLNKVGNAADSELVAALDELIVHTEAHFAMEQQWMEEKAFPPAHCHVREHEGVLEITREVRKRVADGETHLAGVLAKAVAEWFTNHIATMDAVLAAFIKQPDLFTAAGGAAVCASGCSSETACAPEDAACAASVENAPA